MVRLQLYENTFLSIDNLFIDPDYNTIPPISVNLSILFYKDMQRFKYTTLKYFIRANSGVSS